MRESSSTSDTPSRLISEIGVSSDKILASDPLLGQTQSKPFFTLVGKELQLLFGLFLIRSSSVPTA